MDVQSTIKGTKGNSAKTPKDARKAFSTLGLGCVVFFLVGSILQVVLGECFPELSSTEWGTWVFMCVPTYVVAFPLSLLVFRLVPVRGGAGGGKLEPGWILRAFMIMFILKNAGNVVGILVKNVLSIIAGVSAEADAGSYMVSDAMLFKLLFMAIVGPLVEEVIFRKVLIDRMRCYGGKLAVVTTALMFGLFHGNFSQFFYSTAVGLLYGYIYLKTGKLRYSAGLHMAMNFLGVIEAYLFVLISNSEVVSTQLVVLALIFILMLLEVAGSIAGLVFFLRCRKKVSYDTAEFELPKGSRLRTVWLNVGMILFILCCLVMFVTSLLS
ncbi:MAG: CPBP family intramembrane metalloprotease [Lachnospiraceae bacterium]|nr:CPBP family intramembrane metalloprotease [Lachnospiraceae bacterium]